MNASSQVIPFPLSKDDKLILAKYRKASPINKKKMQLTVDMLEKEIPIRYIQIIMDLDPNLFDCIPSDFD